MGRPRTRMKHLPPRMHLKRGAYYHISYAYDRAQGRRRQIWQWLGADYPTALEAYHAIERERARSAKDVPALIAAYQSSEDYKKKSKGTKANYSLFARQLSEAFKGVPPTEVYPEDAQGILDRLSHKPVKAQNMVSFLSTVLSWGAARGWLKVNPLIGFRKGPKAQRKRYITDEEWRALLAAARPELAAFMRFAYLTALRREDVMALRWSAVQEDGIHATVKKTGAKLWIKWNAGLRASVDELRALRGEVASVYLMPSRAGRKPSGSSYLHWFKSAAKAAGCPDVTIHDIRRKRLTDLQLNESVDVAQKVAGHGSPAMTRRYMAAAETPIDLPE